MKGKEMKQYVTLTACGEKHIYSIEWQFPTTLKRELIYWSRMFEYRALYVDTGGSVYFKVSANPYGLTETQRLNKVIWINCKLLKQIE